MSHDKGTILDLKGAEHLTRDFVSVSIHISASEDIFLFWCFVVIADSLWNSKDKNAWCSQEYSQDQDPSC